MKKYRVYGTFYGSKYLGEFTAESPEDAVAMGLESENNHACLCHQCSNEIEIDEYSAQEGYAEEAN